MSQLDEILAGDIQWFKDRTDDPEWQALLLTTHEQYTLYHKIVENGQIELLQYLFEEWPHRLRLDVAAGEQYLIRWAAALGHLDMVKYLAEDCRQRDKVVLMTQDGVVLHKAVENGHYDVVDYLLNGLHCQEIDVTSAKYEAYLCAVKCGHLEILKLILSKMSVTKTDAVHINMGFCFAASYNQLDVVKYLLEESQYSNEIDVTSNKNYALQQAVVNQYTEIFQYLVLKYEDKFDLASSDNVLLKLAAEVGSLDILKYLLEECSQKDKIDVTADSNYVIRWAIKCNHLDIVHYLLEDCKTTVDVTSNECEMLYWSAEQEYTEILAYIIEQTTVPLTLWMQKLHDEMPDFPVDINIYLSQIVEVFAEIGEEAFQCFRELVVDSSNDLKFSQLFEIPLEILQNLAKTPLNQQLVCEYALQLSKSELVKSQRLLKL